MKTKKWNYILIMYLIYLSISKILSFQHVINIKLLRYFTFFLYWVFKIWHVFYTYCTSQIKLVTFQVLRSHLWLGYYIGERRASIPLLFHSNDKVFLQLRYVFAVTRENDNKTLPVIWLLWCFPKCRTLLPRATLWKNRFRD